MATEVGSEQIEVEFHSPLGKDALLVRRILAGEELGRLPEYRVELLRPSPGKSKPSKEPINASELLGLSVNVSFRLTSKKSRYINGLVTRFERGGSTGRYDIYHLEMRPWLWHLTLGADCRIFQDKNVTEIVQSVFDEYGSSSPVDKKGLTGSFRKRPFTVQYRESDFAFVSRLMEEEGIYYYFKHEKDKHTLMLCDGPKGHSAIDGDPELGKAGSLFWAAKQLGNQLREDAVLQWSRVHSLRSLKYTHTDFAPDAPAVDLLGTALRNAPYPKPNDLEVFDYPGAYEDLAMDGSSGAKRTEGKRLAQLRVDAFESAHIVATGHSPYRGMAAGVTFTFADHQDAGGYLVTRADYEVEYGGYEANADDAALGFKCTFAAVPKDIKFQPQRAAVRPTIHGPQTATVVGPSGDEIYTDKYGRVKVQFHWDRGGKKDEKSSCWVRVSHPWASKQFGMVALPRIGDEVVMEFLEGNPDRPLVTGRVYNGNNMSPYVLPAQQTVSGIKTQSSKGGSLSNFNELRFDDKKGSEYVWFQAEKDYNHWVKNDAKVTIKGMRKQLVEKDDQLKINGKLDGEIAKTATLKIGTDTHGTIGGDLIIKVGGDTGLTISGATKVKSTGAMSLTTEAALDVSAASGAKLATDAAIHIKANSGIMIDGGMQLSIKAGAGFIVLDASGVTIMGPIVKINSGGSASPAMKAVKATVPAPKDPPALPEHKDPLAG